MAALAAPAVRSDDAAIVAKAFLRAAERLELSGKVLGGIIGVSEATVSRMKSGAFPLETDRKAYELAIMFIRLFRSLDAIVGGDASVASAWFRHHNTALDARPVDAVQSIAGLTHVIDYLDARRAPL